MKKKYIFSILRDWKESNDGDYYFSWIRSFALRLKSIVCILFGWREIYDYKNNYFGVGIVNFNGPYTDYYCGGQQATWTQIDVRIGLSKWYYTDYTDAWQ